MPEFAVSLRDGSGNISLTASDNTMVINDYSNYIASTEQGHLKADFEDFKKIIVTNPEGVEYTYSTLIGGDESILTPDNYSTTPIQTSYIYEEDGIYNVTLRAVPTWENEGTPVWTDIKVNTSFRGVPAVHFINKDVGYILHYPGFAGEYTYYKTINGGTTWTSNLSDAGFDPLDLHFIDTNTGWICLAVGFVYYTTNGGTSWTTKLVAPGVNLNAIKFINDNGTNKGLVVGDSGTCFFSLNGGASWSQIVLGTAENINDVQIISSTVAHLVGDNGTFITLTNWQSVFATISPAIAFTSEDIYSLSFINSSTGYVAGANGIIFKTTNSGITWTSVSSGVSTDINSIMFYDSNNGGFCGTSGVVKLTTDGGTTWVTQTLDSPLSNVLNDIYFVDADNIFIGGGANANANNVVQKYSANYNTYDEDDCVYHSGTLYQANTDTYNTTPGVSSDWDVILEANLPEKYNITENILVREYSAGYYANALIKASCSALSKGCNDELLCSDTDFINAIKMDLAFACSQILSEQEDYDKADVLINEIKYLNDCCND